jgi:hypothetical protein
MNSLALSWSKATIFRHMNRPARFFSDVSRSRLAAFAVALLIFPTGLAIAADEAAVAKESPWKRVVMIGASVTSGFVASEPLGGTNTEMHRLSRYVEAALLAPHEPVKNLGSPFLFLQPEKVGPQQVEQALKEKPTLVIGVDFLFWSCYGAGKTEADRLARFETGLKLLEKFECPLVIGDIPDASAAVNGMLRPDQMPSAEAMAAANKRLREWMAGRKGAIVPLSEFMRDGMANKEIKIGNYTVPEGKSRACLQKDKLHPSPPGCSVIALAILEAFQAAEGGNFSKDFRRDAQEIYRIGVNGVKIASRANPKASSSAE